MATRKTANLPARDLTAGINDADYLASVQTVWDAAKRLARSYGWCSSWVGYLRSVSKTFPTSRTTETVTLPATVEVSRETLASGQVPNMEDSNTEDLRAIRGGVYYFAQQGHITFGEANDVLEAAGLNPYVPEVPARDDWYAYVPPVHFSVPLGTDRETVRASLVNALESIADNDIVTVNRERSAFGQSGYPDLYTNTPRPEVPDSEVIAPRHEYR